MSDNRILITLHLVSFVYHVLEIRKSCGLKPIAPRNGDIEMLMEAGYMMYYSDKF